LSDGDTDSFSADSGVADGGAPSPVRRHASVAPCIAGRLAAAGGCGHYVVVGGRILYLVGGAPRVGKSVLAQRLLETEGIPWLPTDVVRTVLRRVLPELDAADQDPVDAARLAEVMYPHIEQVAEVCAEEAERFLIEGFELSPWYRGRLQAALEGTTVRACFLGHSTFSTDDLASYCGPKPQHEGDASRAELTEAAAWIRHRSHQLREECREEGLPYVDVGAVGFEAALRQARRDLIGRNQPGLSDDPSP
jgi:predicted kinase